MSEEKQLTEQESLQLIANMIKKAKGSYHDTGIGSLLWGTVVSIASLVTYLRLEYKWELPFDIWLIVLAAIIPQIIISIREKKSSLVKQYDDDITNNVWMAYGLTIFGLSFYQTVVSDATQHLIQEEGWSMVKHYADSTKVDEPLRPFAPSFYSIYILIYAFPTLVTGLVKKFKPMIYGSIITYGLFIASCYTEAKYDNLLGAFAAIICWLIPGIILRKKYLAQRKANV